MGLFLLAHCGPYLGGDARDLVHSRHHYRSWDHDPRAIDRFTARIVRARLMMAEYQQRLNAIGNSAPDVAIMGSDARALNLADGEVDLVLTSAPYCSALDYTRAHMFAVACCLVVLDTGLGIALAT